MLVLLQIVQVLLNVVWWIIVIQAILSWLIAFNVINTYNDTVRLIWEALKKITRAASTARSAASCRISARSTCRRWWCC